MALYVPLTPNRMIGAKRTSSRFRTLAHVVMGEVALRSEIERRRESEEQLALLGQELTHRIKNIFAVTGSLVAVSATAGGTIEEFVAAVRQRLNALAKAHEYVRPNISDGSEAEPGSALGGLLQALLAAYKQDQLEISSCDQIL